MAPKVDLNNLPAVENIQKALGSMNKAELMAVAIYARLYPTAEAANAVTKDKLATQLKPLITNSEDAVLASFGTFRTRITAKGEASQGRKLQKSDERDEEDEKQEKLLIAPTGANKKLLTRKAETDPPPQFAHIGIGIKVSGRDKEVEDDNPSPLTSPAPDEQDHTPSDTEIAPQTGPPAGVLVAHDLKVLVSGLGSGLQTFFIFPEQRKNIIVVELPDGTFITTWKEILPALFNSISSPIKGEFISVKGVGLGQSFGTVKEIMRGNFSAVLQLGQSNKCVLELQGDGMLGCQVLCENTTAKHFARILEKGRDSDSDGQAQASSSAFSSGIAPLTLAQARPPRTLKRTEKTPKQLLLGQLFNAKTYPPAMRKLGEMLGRWNDSQRVLEEAKPYLRSKGGNIGAVSGSGSYALPAEWANDSDTVKQGLANYTFDQKELLEAVNIGNTSHNNDAKLFLLKHARGLKYDDDAAKFVAGDDTLDKTTRVLLSDLSKGEWEARLEKRVKKEKKKREAESSKGKGKGKKVATDSSSSSDEEPPRKRKKGVKKAAKVSHSSSELDN